MIQLKIDSGPSGRRSRPSDFARSALGISSRPKMVFAGTRSKITLPPGASKQPVSAYRQSIARPVWLVFECISSPAQCEQETARLAPMRRAVRTICSVGTQVISAATAGGKARQRSA